MRIRKKHIRSVVERLLANNAISGAPVPLEKIAQILGVVVRHTPTEDNLSGFLVRDSGNGRALIGINQNQPLNRQRFSIAHEIGHFLLHAGQDVYVDGRTESGLKVSLRDDESSTGTNPEEIEANVFAAELLMPAVFLAEDIVSYGPLDFMDDEEMLDGVLDSLAKKYQVSKQAITYRLVNLEYVRM